MITMSEEFETIEVVPGSELLSLPSFLVRSATPTNGATTVSTTKSLRQKAKATVHSASPLRVV